MPSATRSGPYCLTQTCSREYKRPIAILQLLFGTGIRVGGALSTTYEKEAAGEFVEAIVVVLVSEGKFFVVSGAEERGRVVGIGWVLAGRVSCVSGLQAEASARLPRAAPPRVTPIL